jgi:hypothetical protein
MPTPQRPTRVTISTGKRDQTPAAHLIHEPVSNEPEITPLGAATVVVLAICIILILAVVVALLGKSPA